MTEQPLLSNGQLIAYTVSIVSILGGVVSFLFWQYKAARDKSAEECQEEKLWLREQLISFRKDFAVEAKEDRAVMEKLRETVQAATDPVPRGRR